MRFLIVFFMLAFMVTSSVAAPVAMCRHGGEAGHEAALASGDAALAASAHAEESAGSADKKKASLTDGGVLSGVLVTELPAPETQIAGAAMPWPLSSAGLLAGAGPDLLLDPPIA